MFEIWTGHPLLAETVVRPDKRAGSPISNFPVPESQGDEIRHCCQFIGSLLRSLAHLPWERLARFPPFFKGAHGGSLRHFGWSFFQGLGIGLLGYTDHTVSDLFCGTHELRYCSSPFCNKLRASRFIPMSFLGSACSCPSVQDS